MKIYLLAVVAVVAGSAPAQARDSGPYIGIEGGILSGRDNDVDEFVDYTTSQNPAAPLAPAGPIDQEFDDVFRLNYKMGYDVAAVAGYDFGFFRLELELGYKRAGFDHLDPDDITDDFLAFNNLALNRPSAAPDPGAPGLPALTLDDFDLDDNISVLSAMANGLIDIGITGRLSVFAGGGYGRARVKALGNKDSAWAFQYMAGIRYVISPTIELGIKHRYFDSGIIKVVSGGGVNYAGNPNRLTITPPGGAAALVDQTTSALVFPEIEGRFRARSLLATLTYNFGRAEPPPPPLPPPPAPPPPPPPATQTCPDGAVILATDTCPLPPPPQAPPPPESERG